MQLALTLNPFVDSDLQFAQQLGVDDIVADVPAWERDALSAACPRVKHAGLRLRALTCLPAPLMARALAGQPDSEEALATVSRIITDLGELGVPLLGYAWPLADTSDGAGVVPGRGGALSALYRVPGAAGQDGRAGLWERLAAFLERVLPVAEAAGVRLAYRTDLSLAALPEGVRILDSVPELDRLFQVAPSPYHGLDLDHGFVTQVLAPGAGMEPDEVVRRLGATGRLFAVRLRALRATDGGAQEIFLDEDKAAVLHALQAYRAAGFDGPLCPFPSPAMTGDTAWMHKGVAFSTGYVRALLQAMG